MPSSRFPAGHTGTRAARRGIAAGCSAVPARLEASRGSQRPLHLPRSGSPPSSLPLSERPGRHLPGVFPLQRGGGRGGAGEAAAALSKGRAADVRRAGRGGGDVPADTSGRRAAGGGGGGEGEGEEHAAGGRTARIGQCSRAR